MNLLDLGQEKCVTAQMNKLTIKCLILHDSETGVCFCSVWELSAVFVVA